MLTVSEQDGTLAATLHDEVDGEMEVTTVRFEDGILSYEYVCVRIPGRTGARDRLAS